MFSDSISPIIMIRAIAMRNDKCMSPFNIDKAKRRRKMKIKIGIPINDEADIKGKKYLEMAGLETNTNLVQ
jgi:hypothetical protein